MANAIQHAALVVCVLDLLHLDHLGLLQDLHGIEAVVVLRLHQVDSTEAPRAQRALELEVLLRVLALCNALRLLRLFALRLTLGMLTVALLALVYDVVDASGIVWRPRV